MKMAKSRTGRNSPVDLRITRSQLVLPAISSLKKTEQVESPRLGLDRWKLSKARNQGWKSDRTYNSPSSPSLPVLYSPAISQVLQHSQAGYSQNCLPHLNQDAVFVECRDDYYFLGVCDGHGPFGHEVSQQYAQVLPHTLYTKLRDTSKSQGEVTKTLEKAIKQAAQEVETMDSDLKASGCTCVCALVFNRAVYCANVGDSRAVLGRKSCGIWSVCQLSWDHKPEDPIERQRIESCGGEVALTRSTGRTLRVYNKNAGSPGLAMSRSIGDLEATDIGVISDPDVVTLRLTANDKFLLLASDGLWDVIPSTEAVALVGSCLDQGQASKSLQTLLHLAQSRWLKKGRADDISVILAFITISV